MSCEAEAARITTMRNVDGGFVQRGWKIFACNKIFNEKKNIFTFLMTLHDDGLNRSQFLRIICNLRNCEICFLQD